MEDRRTSARLRRREHVVDTAMRLFEENGYEATTVEQIAAAADISTRSFYRYFATKDGVLAAAGGDMIDDLLNGVAPEPTIDELALALSDVVDERLAGRRAELFFRLLREQPTLAERAALWREQWARQLASGLAARRDRQAPSPDDLVISRVAIATVATALDHWLTDGATTPTRPHVERALRTLRLRLEPVPEPGQQNGRV